MEDIKARQVCAAVERILAAILGGEIEDERLNQLSIVAVEPAPNVARIRVICIAQSDVGQALEALPGATSYMRQQIAKVLQRRKTPQLEFVVLPKGAWR